MTGGDLEICRAGLDDPRAAPLLAGLMHEYRTRYGAGADQEMSEHDSAEFDPPAGGFLLLLHNGQTVAGGGFRRYNADTAEIKRIWTNPAHRRLGLARRLLAALEAEAAGRGYRRLYLLTGPHQPEAHRLYTAAGYHRLPDLVMSGGVHILRFEKPLLSRLADPPLRNC